MALRKIGKVYYAYYREDGRQHTRSLCTHDHADAVKLHADFMAILRIRKARRKMLLEAGQPVPAEHIPPAQHRGLPLADLISELEKIAPLNTAKKNAIRRFAAKVGVKYCHEVTPAIALAYLENFYSNAECRNFKSFNNNKSALNSAFRAVLVRAGMTASPFAGIANRTVRNIENHRPVTDAEAARIIQQAQEPFKTVAMLGFFAGMDISTAINLPWAAVHMEEKIIRWHRIKEKKTWFTVGIHPQLLAHLATIPQGKADTPITSAWFPPQSCKYCKAFRQLFADCKVHDTAAGKASFHSFRTSFFTRCDAAGLNRRVASLTGGHRDDRMNDWYSHDVSAAHEVEKLPDLMYVV